LHETLVNANQKICALFEAEKRNERLSNPQARVAALC
jgi:hypothetical protein